MLERKGRISFLFVKWNKHNKNSARGFTLILNDLIEKMSFYHFIKQTQITNDQLIKL
jgi:hypothetical protein